MGRYLGSWKIDDVIRVHKQTSSVTTGAATDAETVPTWRVYEDDTAVPVTTGSFATLNAQTGFYVAAITLAAAIGYEKGKTYAVRSQATVNAVIGADVDSFQIEAEVDVNTLSAAAPAGWLTAGAITDGALTAAKFGAGFITAGSFSGNALSGMAVTVGSTAASAIAALVDMTVNATAAAAIADQVWARTSGGYTTAGSMGFQINSGVAAAVTAGSIGAVTVGATAASAIAAAVTAGSIGAVTVGATSRAAIVDEVWDEPKAGHITADTYGDYLDSTTGAIKAETAAIKAKTDLIFAGTGNSIAADIKYVNGVSVTGNGQAGTEWGPGA